LNDTKFLEDELSKHYYAWAEIQKLTHRLKEWEEKYNDSLEQPNMAVDPSKARVQKSEIDSPVERIVEIREKLIDWCEDNIRDNIRVLEGRISSIDRWIQATSLTVNEERCIRLQYLENNKPGKVAELMNYDDSMIRRFRASALDKLQRSYDEIYKSGA
jgi:hypothetical protein